MNNTIKSLYKVYRSNDNQFKNTMKVLRLNGNEETSRLLNIKKKLHKDINRSIVNENLSIVVQTDLIGIGCMVDNVINGILNARGYDEYESRYEVEYI